MKIIIQAVLVTGVFYYSLPHVVDDFSNHNYLALLFYLALLLSAYFIPIYLYNHSPLAKKSNDENTS